MDSLTGLLMRPENLYLMAAVAAIQETIQRMFPRLKARPLWVRVAPMLPLVLCSIGVWIPGVADPTVTAGLRVMTGIILGFVVAGSYKVVMQSVLGKDSRLAAQIVNAPTDQPAAGGGDAKPGDVAP